MEEWIQNAYRLFSEFVINWLPLIILIGVGIFNQQDSENAQTALLSTIDDIVAALLVLAMINDKIAALQVEAPLGAPPILLFVIWVVYKFFEFRRGDASVLEILMDDSIKGPALALGWIVYQLT